MTARRLRRFFWPVPVDTEVDEEIAAHLELQTKRYTDAGMTEAAARALARERFGNLDLVRNECRDI